MPLHITYKINMVKNTMQVVWELGCLTRNKESREEEAYSHIGKVDHGVGKEASAAAAAWGIIENSRVMGLRTVGVRSPSGSTMDGEPTIRDWWLHGGAGSVAARGIDGDVPEGRRRLGFCGSGTQHARHVWGLGRGSHRRSTAGTAALATLVEAVMPTGESGVGGADQWGRRRSYRNVEEARRGRSSPAACWGDGGCELAIRERGSGDCVWGERGDLVPDTGLGLRER